MTTHDASFDGAAGGQQRDDTLQLLPLPDLEVCCAHALQVLAEGGQPNDRYPLELFRRAVVLREAGAWAVVYRFLEKKTMSTQEVNQVQPSAPGTPPLQHAGIVQVADFETIFLRYQGPVTTFLFRITGTREQSCSLALDVFVQAYTALLGGAIVQETRLSAWLFRIATTTAYLGLRRRHPIAWLPLSRYADDQGITGAALPDPGQGNEECGPAGTSCALYSPQGDGRCEDRELIERVFGQLPANYALCLWLYEHVGLSCAEIADALTISIPAVKRCLMRARERFATLYQEGLPEGGTV